MESIFEYKSIEKILIFRNINKLKNIVFLTKIS